MNYIEVLFAVEPREAGSDVLISQLAELGFDTFMENETGFSGYIKKEDYDEGRLNLALSFYTDFYKISYSTKIIPQQNWNKQWEESFQPIEIGELCYIRAPFHEVKVGFKYEIVIEPKMSFGTGHHATTQLMMRQLLTLEVRNKSVLDMGCGTGVLAILASMLGANPVLAIDIDEWSYENTVENLEKNKINNVIVQKGDVELIKGKHFHTILANINKNILLRDMALYIETMDAEGKLLLSGFFETDAAELTDKATSLGLIFADKKTNGEWAMLQFTKK